MPANLVHALQIGVNAGRVCPLSSKMCTTDQAKADFAAYISKANSLSAAANGTPKNQRPAAGSAKPDRFTKLKTLQNELITAEDKVIADIVAGSCTVLGGGCFAAGTKLWTPDGYRRIEEFQVGDLILSRDEHHPAGLIEPKPVEKIFVRLTEVWHLHVGEQTIRTTAEHPFYVHDKAWVPAGQLQPGDWILTAAGDWKKVEEAWNTGEIETVYNLTVADWHTYFVGDEGWGWAAWAHNTCYYHGTSKEFAASIVSNGIDTTRFKPKKDFGKGFYTTTILAQAKKWADGGAVLRWNVPDTLIAGLQQLDFGNKPSVEWQNTVTQGRQGLLDVTPYPLHVDVVSGVLLLNPKQAERNPLTARGDGQQTVWITDKALRVLQTNKPFYMGGQ